MTTQSPVMGELCPHVAVINGQIKTTSLKVAEHFGKRHDNVMKAIKNLDCSPEFNALNFEVVEYIDMKGEKRPAYEITRDGFTFLAMGFTGKAAAKWKEAYINAFNAMHDKLFPKNQYGLKFHADSPLSTYPTPEQREPLLNVIKQLSSITAELTKVVMDGEYIAKNEPEPKLQQEEPIPPTPDYFPLLIFSKGTLEYLAEKVDNAIKIKKAEERKKLIAKIETLAKQSNIGIEFYDLESRKKELPVQYRNPDNPIQTWRGRGIMPLWLQVKIANGHQKEEFKEPPSRYNG